MLKKYLCMCVAVLTVLQITLGVSASEQMPVKTMANTEIKMLNADYWIDKIEDRDKVIMSLEEIQTYNKEIMETMSNVSYDLPNFSEKITRKSLTAHVDISFPTAPCFINGIEVGEEYWDKLRAQINTAAIKDENEVKFGFTVTRTNLKIFPTSDIVSDAANDFAFDQFQNTAVLAYEPVLILHQSLDAKWLYIYMHNCSGWTLASNIAFSKDKATWLAQQKSVEEGQFLVVTGNKIKLDYNFESPELSELEFSMGTILPLAEQSEIPAFVDGRAPYDSFVVKLPVRNEKGEVVYKLALVPVSKDVSIGYLEFTRENILNQVFKLHGDRYGWGGMLNARDCSSLVLEVYRCFGFRLPRNTESQVKCPGKTLNVEGLSVKGREAMLDELQPGAALYFPGHTMIYLGKDQGRYYVISALGMYAEFPDGSKTANIIRTRTVVVNDLNVKRGSGKLWIECLTAGKQFEKTEFADLTGYSKKEEIENLADRFIVSGKNDNMFNPLGRITHSEISKILSIGFKVEQDKEYALSTFRDLKDSWCSGYAGGLAKAGYVDIPNNKMFEPNRLADFDYMKSIVTLVLKKNGIDTTTTEGSQLVTEILKVDESSYKGIKNSLMTRYKVAVIVDNLLKSIAELKK
ncbi:SH3 domain-containing protein [Acetivibrio cellulolyticus]|uniref:SH3 domain-containing protein n=1 Tax=Acetivibrio cellulolyticus TaxID=35830 RepID=UPI0002FB639A|nr:SH3 domain-containing protein [Acetivibrio cellulolyticus]